ncbi:MAG: hypothetical protein JWN99_1544, partial [Ilumatobacteraceae bacterium]|nr:hypothetical protein [Ilumatobacteraceae bacterium]
MMACSLSWMAPIATAAMSDIGLVDGPDRFLLDASDDGRFVLTGTHFGPHRIVDHATGEIIPLPPEADWSFVLSGDGRLAFFTSDATLTSDDLDGGEDVFSYEWATGAYRLWSPGWLGWDFVMDLVDAPLGDADRTGSTVAFTGTRPSLEYSPFVSDGTTV